jgi:DNA-binding IclR family transcriptional regulator
VRTLNLLAAHPGGQASAAELAVELTAPVAEATATLEHLVDSRLVDSPAPGRYRVQGLLRHYATELPDELPCASLIGRRRRSLREAAAA